MIHDIDLVLALVGSEVVAVEAMGSTVLAPTNDFAAGAACVSPTARSRISPPAASPTGRSARSRSSSRIATGSADLAARTVTSFERGHAVLAQDEIAVPPSDNLALEIDSFLDAAAGLRPAASSTARPGSMPCVVADMIIQRIGQTSRRGCDRPYWRPH